MIDKTVEITPENMREISNKKRFDVRLIEQAKKDILDAANKGQSYTEIDPQVAEYFENLGFKISVEPGPGAGGPTYCSW